MIFFTFIPFVLLGTVLCGQPEVACPAPRSPEHGQAFLYRDGSIVKFVCEPGYRLKGNEFVSCINGQWEDPDTTCVKTEEDEIKDSDTSESKEQPPIPPARPLFSWGSETEEKNETDVNATDSEMPLSDEARVRLLMYPRRTRVITTRVHSGRLQSSTESEDEEKKNSRDEKSSSGSTTIHLDSPPSVLYVRRTVTPSKSEAQKQASLKMTVQNGHDVEVVSLPRAAVSLDEKAYQSDETLRQLYWYAYHYPNSYVDYRTGAPVSMTLTESQLAWINSLHPELRDQYLKDLYVMRAGETVDGERTFALLRRYDDVYNYYYHEPYLRRPVSLIMDNVAATYDYSCNQAGYPVIPAPTLPNMHVARYDSRKNNLEPHNYYLTAVYQCDPGYYLFDSRSTELYCSKGRWVGMSPVCLSHP